MRESVILVLADVGLNSESLVLDRMKALKCNPLALFS